MENEKRLVASRIQTPDGTILWSRFGHDFVTYQDANGVEYMLDGGNDYQRSYDERKYPEELKSKNISIYDDAPWEVQRDFRLRGTFDKEGNRIWVPMSRLSNNHLDNIIKDDAEYYDRTDTIWTREMNYRKKNHIVVEEHDYTNEAVSNIIKLA